MTPDVFVVDAVRTPVGRIGGALSGVRPDDLAAHVVRTLLDRNPGLDPARIDEAPKGRGIGLAALKRRFALDYEGRARLQVTTAPGAGFRVHLWIPQ